MGSAAVVGLPAVLGGRVERASRVLTPDLAAATLERDGLLVSIRTTGPGEAMLRAWPTLDPVAATNTCTMRLVREDGEELHREVVPLPLI